MTAPTANALVAWPRISNIVGLPSNQAKGMGMVSGLGPPAIDAKDAKFSPIKITTGIVPGSPNGTGTASLYIFGSEDGVAWPYGIDPQANADQVPAVVATNALQIINQRNLIQSINCPISATAYYFDWCTVLQRLNAVPTCVAMVILNSTGGDFSSVASGFAAMYRVILFG